MDSIGQIWQLWPYCHNGHNDKGLKIIEFDFDMEGLSPLLGAIAGAVLPPGLPCPPVPDDLGPIPVITTQ